jgi:hypothetical protein
VQGLEGLRERLGAGFVIDTLARRRAHARVHDAAGGVSVHAGGTQLIHLGLVAGPEDGDGGRVHTVGADDFGRRRHEGWLLRDAAARAENRG